MKRWLMLLVGAITLLFLVFGPTAQASSKVYYTGSAGPGQDLLFSVDDIGGVPNFDPLILNTVIVCTTTGDRIQAGFFFSGFEIPLDESGGFDLNFSDIFSRFDWSGTVRPDRALGTVDAGFPAYDAQGGLQDCNNGVPRWKARALSGPAARAAGPTPTYRFDVTKDARGQVHITVQH